jgi:hypothetical protein
MPGRQPADQARLGQTIAESTVEPSLTLIEASGKDIPIFASTEYTRYPTPNSLTASSYIFTCPKRLQGSHVKAASLKQCGFGVRNGHSSIKENRPHPVHSFP